MLKEVGPCARAKQYSIVLPSPLAIMITAYTGRAAPITRGVQRVRQEIRASQPDPQRSTIAELFAPRFLCERGCLTRFRTGRVFQRRVDRRSRFNKIRSIDLGRKPPMTSLSDCIMAVRIRVSWNVDVFLSVQFGLVRGS